MSTRNQSEIEKHLKIVEELRQNGFIQDIIDVLQNKKHTREEVANVCRAFLADFDKEKRQANLLKARAERKNKPKEAVTPVQ